MPSGRTRHRCRRCGGPMVCYDTERKDVPDGVIALRRYRCDDCDWHRVTHEIPRELFEKLCKAAWLWVEQRKDESDEEHPDSQP